MLLYIALTLLSPTNASELFNKVIVVGDSWAVRCKDGHGKDREMFSFAKEEGYETWPQIMARRLARSTTLNHVGMELPKFTHMGITSGELVEDVQKYAGQILDKAPQHSLVVIHVGGNDITDVIPSIVKEGFKSFIMSDLDKRFRKIVEPKVDEIVSNIQRIIKAMRKRGYRRFLVAELPVNRHMPRAKLITKVPFIDLNHVHMIQRIVTDKFQNAFEHTSKGMKVFREMRELNRIGLISQKSGRRSDSDYIDGIHPIKDVHEALARKAEGVVRGTWVPHRRRKN